MSKALLFMLLAFVIAYVNGAAVANCDPHARGDPDCSNAKANQRFRNNWDPAHYFVCVNGKAVQEACPINSGYDHQSQSCVSWSQWQWQPPCVESANRKA